MGREGHIVLLITFQKTKMEAEKGVTSPEGSTLPLFKADELKNNKKKYISIGGIIIVVIIALIIAIAVMNSGEETSGGAFLLPNTTEKVSGDTEQTTNSFSSKISDRSRIFDNDDNKSIKEISTITKKMSTTTKSSVEENVCDPDPCKNGGTCSNLNGGFDCKCRDGYKGETCDEKKQCEPNPCKNGGICGEERNEKTPKCECSGTGYNGPTCESKINYCLPINPCQNNGECEDDRFTYSCQCSKYWSGDNCTRAQTRFAVKEVKMKIDDHEGGGGCGGDDTTV